jgi:hypothetical protein
MFPSSAEPPFHPYGTLSQIHAAKLHAAFVKGKVFVDIGPIPVSEHFL